MRRWRRRAFGLLVIAISVTLATAAAVKDPGGAFITADPNIVAIRNAFGVQNTGATTLVNGSNTPFTVGSITYSCDSAMQLENGSGNSQFVIGAGSGAQVVVDCPASLPTGLHRCTFTVKDTANFVVLSFLGFCETFDSPQLSAMPASLIFPSTPIGQPSAPQPVTITNLSMTTPVSTLQLQVDNDNFLVGTPCQDSLGCDDGPIPPQMFTTVNVICQPNGPGTHNGNLYAVGDNGFALQTPPIPLTCPAGSGAGDPVLTLTPPNVLLGGIEVNGGTDNATIELTNAGTFGSLTINTLQIAGLAQSDWSFTIDGQCPVLPCPLGPGNVLNVRLTFDPSGFNSRPAELIVGYTDPNGNQQESADLDGTGLGATLELISSGPLDFGTVPLDTVSMMQTFKLKNQGNRQTTATLSANPAAPFTFPMTVMVDPGETDVVVTCSSSSEVTANRTLTISGADAPMPNDTQTLICDVRDTAILVTPSAIPLGERRIGSSVPAQQIDITKSGGSEVALASAALETSPDDNLDLAGSDPFLTQLMTPASTTLVVTAASEAPLNNKVLITPMSGEAIAVPITGAIVRPAYQIPTMMTLGTFCIDQPTSKTSITYESTGTATIEIQDVTLQRGASSPFKLEKREPTTYPSSLSPNGGTAEVLIEPKRIDNDGSITMDIEETDTLLWSDDFESPSTDLTVKYVLDGGAIAPGILDFGDVPIRIAVDNAQAVTLQNCSLGDLVLVEPTVPAPFELTNQFPTQLGPADRATFSIAFHPTEVGPVETELVVMSMDGMEFRVALKGNGIAEGGGGGDDTGTVDETSFYACGCRSNNPSGVLVILFAVCGLLVRSPLRRLRRCASRQSRDLRRRR